MKITKKDSIKHNILRSALLMALFVVPVAASAQSTFSTSYPTSNYSSSGTSSNCATQQSLCTLINSAIQYFNLAVYLIMALVVVTFIWNVYKYFIVSDPENRVEASKYVMFSVIGIFVILSFWGLVNIVSNTLNLNTTPGTINVQALTGASNTTSSANPTL